jgi:hypothetical protein
MQTNEEEMKKLVLVGMTIAALSLAALSPADAPAVAVRIGIAA